MVVGGRSLDVGVFGPVGRLGRQAVLAAKPTVLGERARGRFTGIGLMALRVRGISVGFGDRRGFFGVALVGRGLIGIVEFGSVMDVRDLGVVIVDAFDPVVVLIVLVFVVLFVRSGAF